MQLIEWGLMFPRNLFFIVGLLGVLGIAAVILIGPLGLLQLGPDSFDARQYFDIAGGGSPNVIPPFAYRVLHPLFARYVSGALGIDLATTFILIAAVNLLIVCAAVLQLTRTLRIPVAVIVAILFQPLLFVVFRDVFMNDAAFLALALVLFASASAAPWLAVVCGFVLPFVRETTIITVCTGALMCRRWQSVAGIAISGIVAFAIWKVRIATGPMNAHGMNDVVYSIMKFPINLFENTTGLRFWHNVIHVDRCQMFIDVRLPTLAVFGQIHEIGICNPSIGALGYFWVAALGGLGLIPIVVARHWREVASVMKKNRSLAAIGAYGALMVIFAIAGGKGTDRLLVHAWPALLILVPAIPALTKSLERIVHLHIATAGIALLFFFAVDWLAPSDYLTPPAVVALAFLNIIAWKNLRRLS